MATNPAPPLLVPISVEALVVNTAVQNETAWNRWLHDYQNLAQFSSPVPPPFSQNDAPDEGIHVRWSLPRALTHGSQVSARATATVSGGKVTGIVVDDGAFGYDVPPLVTISGGDGQGAAAIASVQAGIVSAINLSEQGSGYTTPPTVHVAPSPEICFPLVPNRWLVVRYGPPAKPNDPRPTKTWLLTSDTIDNSGTGSPFVNPVPTRPGAIEPTSVGAAITPLAAWTGEAGSTADLFLRAVGPGDATFHAYQPGVQNVFSLYDDLDADLARTVSFTYLVVGWYSDAAQDPLHGRISEWGGGCRPTRTPWADADEWQALMDELAWAVEGTQAPLPDTSVYHGLVYDVDWNNVSAPKWKGNEVSDMTVAVGNTAVDAMAALLEHQTGGTAGELEAQALEAFQHGYLHKLDEPDGAAQLELEIHRATFGTAPGGTLWRVTAADDGSGTDGQLSPGAHPATPPLTAAQEAALAQLNRTQCTLDAARRHLASLQGQLYDAWWKQHRAPHVSQAAKQLVSDWKAIVRALDKALDSKQSGSLYDKVVTAQASVAQLAGSVPLPTDSEAVARYAKKVLSLDPALHQLRASAMPRFHQPVDPVVLVAGLTPSDGQGSLAGGGPLACRFADQALTGVNVEIGGATKPVSVATGTLASGVPATPTSSFLRAAVADGIASLATECFFVDATNAPVIVQLGLGSTDQAVITKLTAAMIAGSAGISTRTNPLQAAVAFQRWGQQPFAPLFLEWEVTFFFTAGASQIAPDNWPFADTAFVAPKATTPVWVFNGRDYDWYGGNPEQSSTDAQGYAGRTFLTPQATAVFIRRLEKYLEGNPNADLKAVDAFIDKVGKWNFLSQRLSGLSDQMIMRDVGAGHPPDASVAARVGAQYDTTPDPEKGDQDTAFGSGTPFFFPVRGGFLTVNRLQVVDAFGQTVDLMQAGGNVGSGVSWVPVRGRELVPSAHAKLTGGTLFPTQAIKLSPRVVQEARLDFRFVSATDDKHDTGQFADSNPVCGWVVPNHLDGGLALYDASGAALGELLLASTAGGTQQVTWFPAPGSAAAVSAATQIPNVHLRGFATGLIALTDPETRFNELLGVIDETLWAVDPLGGRDDQNLSVLIGRPLALVRARLQLELERDPVVNQSWRDTLGASDTGLEKIVFGARLGSLELYNDGLLGYFDGDKYSTFNSVHTPEGFTPSAGDYLTPIGVGGNYIPLSFGPAPTASRFVSMLLDPRGDVHATTGIMPTKAINLPATFFEPALRRMAVTFRVGPVLTDPQAVRLPFPAERHGTWSWVQRPSPGGDPEVDGIVRADDGARLPDTPPRLIEGWLKLTPPDS